MERLVAAIGLGVADPRVGGGDGSVDRLSCSYTVRILSIIALGVAAKQWAGSVPISCWCPAHFTSAHCDFTNNVCWTQDTYYLPLNVFYIPKTAKGKAYISYYQWVALVLVIQACFFYLPRPLWRLFNKKSGIAVSTVTDAALECQNSLDSESREKVMKYLVKHMSRFLVDLSRKQLMWGKVRSIWLCFRGNYLFFSYILIKFVYLANVVGQLFWINKFLGTNYHMYGFGVLGKMLQGESWSTSDRFPRVTLCDFRIRMLGNMHNYTVQCSLPMNLFNEKIYIFIWFWFVFVAIATAISILAWFAQYILFSRQVRFVKTRLVAMGKIKYNVDKEVNKFVRQFLHGDGIFLVRLVARNSSDMIAAELLCGLWDHYKENKQLIEKLDSREVVQQPRKKDLKTLLRMEEVSASLPDEDVS